MPIPSVTDFENAKVDVDDLADIINGDETVTTRLGGDKLSVSEALSQIIVGEVVLYSAASTYSNIEDWVEYSGVVYRPLPSALPIGPEAFNASRWSVAQGFATADNVTYNSITVEQKLNNLDVDDYTALRAVTPAQFEDGDTIRVTDSNIAGPGQLRKVTAHGLTDNGGTIIVIDIDSYWERDISAGVNLMWFAVGDGVADDYTIIQSVLTDFSGSIYSPPGKTYSLSAGLELINDNTYLDLNGSTLSSSLNAFSEATIECIARKDCVIARCSIERNQLVVDDFDGGNGIYVANSNSCHVIENFIQHCEYAITLQQFGGLINVNCHVLRNRTNETRYGGAFDGARGTKVDGNEFRNFSLYGWKARMGVSNTTSICFFTNNTIEDPLTGGAGGNFHGIICESDEEVHGIVIEGNIINLGNPTKPGSCVRMTPDTGSITGDAQNATIKNNYLYGSNSTIIDCRVNAIIEGNIVNGDPDDVGTNVSPQGIFCTAAHVTVSNNHIHTCTDNGIEIDGCLSSSVTGNKCFVPDANQGIFYDGACVNSYAAGNYIDSMLRGYRVDNTSEVSIGKSFYSGTIAEEIDDNTTAGTVYLLDSYKTTAITQEYTIATGAITPVGSYFTIDTEGDAASDDLDTITATNYREGDEITVTAANSGRTVVLKDDTGNIRGPGDISLDHSRDAATLIFTASGWLVKSFSDNA
jgi:hypothetical protein